MWEICPSEKAKMCWEKFKNHKKTTLDITTQHTTHAPKYIVALKRC